MHFQALARRWLASKDKGGFEWGAAADPNSIWLQIPELFGKGEL
jgi:hypothetical protein